LPVSGLVEVLNSSNGWQRDMAQQMLIWKADAAAIPISSKFVFSLGSSTLLDRTSSTSFSTTETLENGESVGMNTTYRIDGAMNDVRLATSWTPKNWLRLGFGLHAISGHNLVAVTQSAS